MIPRIQTFYFTYDPIGDLEKGKLKQRRGSVRESLFLFCSSDCKRKPTFLPLPSASTIARAMFAQSLFMGFAEQQIQLCGDRLSDMDGKK
jgi:hypothetical protein